MVFCNKYPLSILTQVFVSYFYFLTSEIGKFDNPNIKRQISLNVLYKYLRVYNSLEFFSFNYVIVRSITAMGFFSFNYTIRTVFYRYWFFSFNYVIVRSITAMGSFLSIIQFVRSITAMGSFLSIMQSYGLLQLWVLFFQLCNRTVYYSLEFFSFNYAIVRSITHVCCFERYEPESNVPGLDLNMTPD